MRRLAAGLVLPGKHEHEEVEKRNSSTAHHAVSGLCYVHPHVGADGNSAKVVRGQG